MHTDDAEMQQVEIIGIVAIEDQQSNSLVRRVLPGLCVDTAGEERVSVYLLVVTHKFVFVIDVLVLLIVLF